MRRPSDAGMTPSHFSWPMPRRAGMYGSGSRPPPNLPARWRGRGPAPRARATPAAPALARSLAGRVVGRSGPRDLAAVRDGITAAAGLAAELENFPEIATELAQATQSLRRPAPATAAQPPPPRAGG